jgi:hypothetical protein
MSALPFFIHSKWLSLNLPVPRHSKHQDFGPEMVQDIIRGKESNYDKYIG